MLFAKVVHVIDPSRFHVILGTERDISNFDIFHELVKDYAVKQAGRGGKSIQKFTENCEVLAQCFSVSEKWLRGVVLNLADDEVDVNFVDYGLTEYVSESNVMLFPKFLKDSTPKTRFRICRLKGMESNVEWAESSINYFKQFTDDKTLKVIILEESRGMNVIDLEVIHLDKKCSLSEIIERRESMKPCIEHVQKTNGEKSSPVESENSTSNENEEKKGNSSTEVDRKSKEAEIDEICYLMKITKEEYLSIPKAEDNDTSYNLSSYPPVEQIISDALQAHCQTGKEVRFGSRDIRYATKGFTRGNGLANRGRGKSFAAVKQGEPGSLGVGDNARVAGYAKSGEKNEEDEFGPVIGKGDFRSSASNGKQNSSQPKVVENHWNRGNSHLEVDDVNFPSLSHCRDATSQHFRHRQFDAKKTKFQQVNSHVEYNRLSDASQDGNRTTNGFSEDSFKDDLEKIISKDGTNVDKFLKIFTRTGLESTELNVSVVEENAEKCLCFFFDRSLHLCGEGHILMAVDFISVFSARAVFKKAWSSAFKKMLRNVFQNSSDQQSSVVNFSKLCAEIYQASSLWRLDHSRNIVREDIADCYMQVLKKIDDKNSKKLILIECVGEFILELASKAEELIVPEENDARISNILEEMKSYLFYKNISWSCKENLLAIFTKLGGYKKSGTSTIRESPDRPKTRNNLSITNGNRNKGITGRQVVSETKTSPGSEKTSVGASPSSSENGGFISTESASTSGDQFTTGQIASLGSKRESWDNGYLIERSDSSVGELDVEAAESGNTATATKCNDVEQSRKCTPVESKKRIGSPCIASQLIDPIKPARDSGKCNGKYKEFRESSYHASNWSKQKPVEDRRPPFRSKRDYGKKVVDWSKDERRN